LTFVGKNNPHSKVLSGFVVGQIKYEAKFNPVKGAIYALYDMKNLPYFGKKSDL
jgi:hypothetical protein